MLAGDSWRSHRGVDDSSASPLLEHASISENARRDVSIEAGHGGWLVGALLGRRVPVVMRRLNGVGLGVAGPSPWGSFSLSSVATAALMDVRRVLLSRDKA